MPYTITVYQYDRTDRAPLTLRIPRPLFWGSVVGFVLLLLAAFWVTVFVLAPNHAANEAAEMKAAADNLAELRIRHADLTEAHTQLQAMYSTSQQEMAEATARLTIAESARAEAFTRQQQLEEEHADLSKRVEFYRTLMNPATDREEAQCYNIDVKVRGDKVTYSLNFLRTEPDATDRLTGRAEIRILTGGDVVQIGRAGNLQSNDSQRLGFKSSQKVSGSFTAPDLPPAGLRIFDVKGYDERDNVITHCWKTF